MTNLPTDPDFDRLVVRLSAKPDLNVASQELPGLGGLYRIWQTACEAAEAPDADEALCDRANDLAALIAVQHARTLRDLRIQIAVAYNDLRDCLTQEQLRLAQDARAALNGSDDEERRLSLLKDARQASGLPLDLWADVTEGLDLETVEILVGRAGFFGQNRTHRKS